MYTNVVCTATCSIGTYTRCHSSWYQTQQNLYLSKALFRSLFFTVITMGKNLIQKRFPNVKDIYVIVIINSIKNRCASQLHLDYATTHT